MRTLLAALKASIAPFILGKGNDTVLSLGVGARRSIQRRRAKPSPSMALEIAVCVRASAWPSSKLSMASVFLFLAPLGPTELLRNYLQYFAIAF